MWRLFVSRGLRAFVGALRPHAPNQGISSPGPLPGDHWENSEQTCVRLKLEWLQGSSRAREKPGVSPKTNVFVFGSVLRLFALCLWHNDRPALPACPGATVRAFQVSAGSCAVSRYMLHPRDEGSGEACRPGRAPGQRPGKAPAGSETAPREIRRQYPGICSKKSLPASSTPTVVYARPKR